MDTEELQAVKRKRKLDELGELDADDILKLVEEADEVYI